MALAPNEWQLAVVGFEPTGEAPGRVERRGYLVDLETDRTRSWDWPESVRRGDDITAFCWDETSTSVYLSFAPPGGSLGERSYQYDFSTDDSVELTGLATVLDVGLQGQVLGLASAAPYEHQTDGGGVTGSRPLALWQDGKCIVLPRDDRFVAWSEAWISDDGKTVVALGETPYQNGTLPCLEVLKLNKVGWQVDWLFFDAALYIIPGVAFQPNSSVFWFQACSYPLSEGLLAGVRLYGLDTATKQVNPSIVLPDADQPSRAIGIGTPDCRGST
jgi:hypothetical protein